MRFGSTYMDLRYDDKAALLYNILYMLRRLLIAFLATLCKEYPFAQVQLIVFHCIGMIIYTIYVKPFEMPLLNNMETFNECCIIVATYHLFYFTDYLDDPEM
jgi:hypothetical protein